MYCPCASRDKLKENKNTQDTVEPRYNEVFAIKRFRYIEVLPHMFTITGVKKIVRYTDDFV